MVNFDARIQVTDSFSFMRILQLCKKFPYPLKDGESIAVTYLSHAMSQLGCEVSLLSMNTTKHYMDISKLPEEYNHYKEIHVTKLDNQVNAMDAFRNLFSKDSYHVSRFVCSDFRDKLIALLRKNDYDVVQLETLYLAPYIDIIKAHSNALVTMRAHNIEFEIWERISNNTTFLPKRWYLKYLTSKLKRFELDKLNEYDYLISVSERDLLKFKDLGYKNGAISSPIGLDLKNYIRIPKKQSSIRDLCFIGALDWRPNLEGLQWFLEHVWPLVHASFPDIKLHVAGRNTPPEIANLKVNNVVIHGEVPDAVEFINTYGIMVVPLFSGSGMRVKILEGMALSKVVITTTLGMEGIDAEDGKEILIADNPQAFLTKISDVLSGKINAETIGKNALEFVKEYYDHANNAKKLIEKYKYLKENPHYQKQRVIVS